MRIVATMISGNSEAIAADAVASVIDFVDVLCLIDTGITDGTAEVVRKAANGKLHIESFQWIGDFAAARNAALACATQLDAAWALTVDTDERLDFTGYKTRDELHKALSAADVWLVPNKDATYAKERFIRIPTTASWNGRVHEALCGVASRKALPGCSFYELPKSEEAHRAKLERDLAVLLEDVASHGDNPRWHYYLGQTLEGLGETERAIDAYSNCAMLDGWPDESAWACYTAARCCATLGEYRRAEELCARGMVRKPDMPELPWLAGWCCYKRGDYSNAIAWSEIAAALGGRAPLRDSGMFVHLPAWWEAPYDVMRWSHKALGRHGAAAEKKFKEMLAARNQLMATGA